MPTEAVGSEVNFLKITEHLGLFFKDRNGSFHESLLGVENFPSMPTKNLWIDAGNH